MTLETHPKVVLSWVVFATEGVTGFFIAKNYVNSNRHEAMRIRQSVKNRLKQEREQEENQKKQETLK